MPVPTASSKRSLPIPAAGGVGCHRQDLCRTLRPLAVWRQGGAMPLLGVAGTPPLIRHRRRRIPYRQATVEQARSRQRSCREGQAHAAPVFDGNDCVGWCQFGAPDEVPRIKNRAAYEKGRTTSPAWRIACCYVGNRRRRQGVATAALAGALDLIAGLGGGTVEGYPEDAGSVPAGFLFNGALSTYEKLGFTRDRKIGKHRWSWPGSSSRERRRRAQTAGKRPADRGRRVPGEAVDRGSPRPLADTTAGIAAWSYADEQDRT
jgi:GNAT superfamily N-acetyltransferase